MTRRILATALALSMALTSVATAPARAADSGEIGRLLLGVGTLIIIGNELSKQNRTQAHVTRRYVEPRRHVDRDYRRDGRDHRRNDRDYRHNRNYKVVPSACLRQNNYRDGPRNYFGQRCLQNNMRNANRLPGQCRTSVWGRNGWRTVYSAHCLRKHGWSIG